MADELDRETIMKVACIQAVATTLAANLEIPAPNDPTAIVQLANQILKAMEEQGFYP